MEKIAIRRASAADVETIRLLAFEIWPVAYGKILSENQIRYMLKKFYDPAVLVDEMSAGVTFFLACSHLNCVGFAACSALPEQPRCFKLHKLYVLPQHQKTGAGTELLNAVLNEARRANALKLQLQVNRANSAIHFYKKMEFEITGKADFDIGEGYFMNDFIMERLLNEMY